MDTNGWVLLSDDDSFFDMNEDGDEKQIFLGRRNPDSKSVIDVNYFCTSPKSRTFEEASRNFHPRVTTHAVHVPIQLEPRIGKVTDEGLVEENTKDHVGVTIVPSPPTTTEKSKGTVTIVEPDQDTAGNVVFKIKEMESPKSCGQGLFPPLDAGALKFEDNGEAQEIMASPRIVIVDKEVDDSSGGFNFWKWSLNGVGAICSFGVAAATICVMFFGSQQRNKVHLNQKTRIAVYPDDKGIMQVIEHATKLNGAITAVRGVPHSRARIICGGYHDGL